MMAIASLNHLTYRRLNDGMADKTSMAYAIDESEEDYLYDVCWLLLAMTVQIFNAQPMSIVTETEIKKPRF